MITMNVFSDNHYKCNRPIVGSEGEEPVGQNPVVGESDPGNLTGNKYHQWFWQWWWWWWWWWWRWFVLRFTHRLLLNVGDRVVKSCRAAWLWNCAESPLMIVIDIIAMMRDLGLEAASFIAQNLAFYRNTFTLTKLTKGTQETKRQQSFALLHPLKKTNRISHDSSTPPYKYLIACLYIMPMGTTNISRR